MKFAATPVTDVDPGVVAVYVKWFRAVCWDQGLLRDWHYGLNEEQELYSAVHKELNSREKQTLKDAVRG